MFHERLLPTLDDNIRCGNSLIDYDIYSEFPDLSDDIKVKRKINAFNWRAGFRKVSHEGFDAIIGNPPWGAHLTDEVLEYLREKNSRVIVRMIDTYMYFVFSTQQLLKTDGVFGMILPDVLLYQIDNWKLRKQLLDETSLQKILNMGSVFREVTRPSSVLIFKKSSPKENAIVSTRDISHIKGEDDKVLAIKDEAGFEKCPQKTLSEIQNYLFVTKDVLNFGILQKISTLSVRSLSDFIDSDGIQRGVSPDFKDAFVVDGATVKKHKLERAKLRPVITGGVHVKPFKVDYPDLFVIYTSRNDDFSKLPNIKSYIDSYRDKITCREVKEKKHPIYALHRPREESIFTKSEKILGVITEDQIVVALDREKVFATDGIYLFGLKPGYDPRYFLAILNSKLFIFLYRLISMEGGRVLAQVKPTTIATMPIVDPDALDPDRKSRLRELYKSVDLLTGLSAISGNKRGPYGNQSTEESFLRDKIDLIIYDLYRIDESERRTIERSLE